MKRILLILTLLSCEKPQVVKCYTCNQRVTIKNHSTFRKFRECGLSKEKIEQDNTSPYKNGNELLTRCVEEK